jgi:hypothetical protein
MFWQGFIIGIFVGACVGIVVAGLIVSAKRQDHADKDNPELRAAEYAVMNNETGSRQNGPGFFPTAVRLRMAMKGRFLPQKILLTGLEVGLQHLTHSGGGPSSSPRNMS